MKFTDSEIDKLDIEGSPRDFAQLIIKYLCGKDEDILSEDLELLNLILRNIHRNVIKYNQFNEILLLLNRNTVNEGFFNYFFDKNGIKLNDLKNKIATFRGYAMLCFGNFRFAYKELSTKTFDEIKNLLAPYCPIEENIESNFIDRPPIMLDIEKIPKEMTWYTGYLSTKKIKEDIKIVAEQIEEARKEKNEQKLRELIELSENIEKIREYLVKYQNIALKNTDIYLTWDYIDVYIATSMRNKWEFEEVYEFIRKFFDNEKLRALKLRFFDPTQSLCISPRDKGLIEGLMLKRSKCTIYLAQESETMGKDSELATTLAQGKPVIAYVPNINILEHSKKIRNYPLDYFKKRLLILTAQELFDDPIVKSILEKKYPNYIEIKKKFLTELEKYNEKQIFFTVTEDDEKAFKEKFINFNKICNILSEVEKIQFDKRAKLLKETHPLSMQVALHNGVANGVLVIRTSEECAELLYTILTNTIKFNITRKEYVNDVLEKEIGCTVLTEKISGSPFRIVTDYEKLTNSFWNLFETEARSLNRSSEGE